MRPLQLLGIHYKGLSTSLTDKYCFEGGWGSGDLEWQEREVVGLIISTPV